MSHLENEKFGNEINDKIKIYFLIKQYDYY